MAKDKIFALDLGTTKFCLATLSQRKNEVFPYLDAVSVPAQGMRRGMLSDFNEAHKSLNSLIEIAEKEFQCDINKAVVGVSGSHLKSRVLTVKIPLQQTSTIEPMILSKAQELLKNENFSAHREIIHIIPICYQIDDREWISNPVGFSGTHISVKYYVIDADKFYLKDLIQLCNLSGIEVQKIIAEPYASAAVSISEEKKKFGVVLADIGGGTTDGIIFINGLPIHVFTVNIGGKLITNDLSIGLGVPYDEAERIKIIYGLNNSDDLRNHLQVKDVNGNLTQIHQKNTFDILSARIYELGKLIHIEMQKVNQTLGCGVVLTGGGSEISGIETILTNYMKTIVSKAKPEIPFNTLYTNHENNNFSHVPSILNSKYATVAGLIYLELKSRSGHLDVIKSNFLKKHFGNFISWFKELS